ncbi:MAG: hypothetical protein GDA46_00005 [Bdellovibrionales bacterium]|nr:hypothetical protein [Bdellovibrionales bacterium]
MLNYEPKIINTKDSGVREGAKKLKWYGVIKLLDEIWSLKKNISPLKVLEACSGFKKVLKDLSKEARRRVELIIVEYLRKNTDIMKIWGATEKLLIEEGILTEGGIMENVRESIKAEGMQEGLQKGRQEGLQEGMQKIALNLLKEKVEIAFISKITGFSKEEIKKLKKNS